MPDVFDPQKRSAIMRAVRPANTSPELVVRKCLHAMGYRFRLHRLDLPGRPDIVLPRHRKIVLVHGCFWHQHAGCRRAARPQSNAEFWNAKLDKNVTRDAEKIRALETAGWSVLVVWQCEIRDKERLHEVLRGFMA
jgi:DNA mismatch endonuclease (patch repair protein)